MLLRHVALALSLLVCPVVAPLASAESPLRVLFLGDQGHHRPRERAEQITPVLAGRGIDVTYTENLSDLNPATLSKYDALVVYANIDELPAEGEKALLDYVAAGGGFVPLHCASFCFRNSDAYVQLVGAQFLRHGDGEFDTRVVDADHAITRGLEPFRTWDETYVHTKHNEWDRHVLQVRPDPAGDEPWSWTRTHGKGRVFYTAYGHDERTWGHPGFHDLVERGIRWAAAKGDVFDSRPRVATTGLAPFEYQAAKIPNYVPSAKWGTMGKPIDRMQKPLSPEESAKHLALPAGFRAELYASEPTIYKPIALAWDHRGRLWISETIDYPNELQPPGQGRDRITIVEDTDGDGRADKTTVFADKLSIPTSLVFANGGVILSQAPDTLFLKDTNGDDRADEKRVLFTGWGTNDTHAGPSNLRYGPDNWIYGIVGYAGFNGTVGGEPHSFRQGFFRFRPDGSKLEFLRNTNNNSWGVGFSEDGLLFGSTANGCPSVYLPIPNRYYENVRGWSPRVLANIADSNRFFPATDKVRQVDWHGGFTAAAGHALYTARNYPKHYWNSTAFVTEPTGHLVATFTLHRHGADVHAHNGWNLLGSDDEWTSPIVAEVGPDGNVWVVDWYNFIVQHNPTPEGFTTGKGNAYETPLRDKTHGRIYRLTHEAANPSAPPKLDLANPATLVAALQHDNMFWRLHAQRLLVERGKADVVPALIALAGQKSMDAIGLSPGAFHALWTLEGLGQLQGGNPAATQAALAAIGHPSASVRRAAAQVLPRGDAETRAILEARLLDDPDAQVRLAALLALAEVAPSDDAGTAVGRLVAAGGTAGDRWLTEAASAAGARHPLATLRALASTNPSQPLPAEAAQVAERIAEHWARARDLDATEPGRLVDLLEGKDPKVVEAIARGLIAGWPQDRKATLDGKASASLAELAAKASADTRTALIRVARRLGVDSLDKYVAELATTLLATASDAEKPDEARITAARELIAFEPASAEAVRSLIGLITPRTSGDLATGLIAAAAKSEAAEAGPALVEAVPSLTPAVRAEALRALMARAEWTTSLVEALENGAIGVGDLALDQKQALAAHPDAAIAARAKTLMARGGGLPDADRQKVIDSIAALVEQGGDVTHGRAVFDQQCAKCHMHSGKGGKVGPDLTGMATHPRSELLIHILDPSRSVEGNFVAYTVATTDGRVLTGLLASESKTAIELVDAEGKTSAVLREEIEELAASKKSLMPEGFEKQVSPTDLRDLLAFLTQRGKYLPLDLRSVATVNSTRGMFYSEEADPERLIFSDWGPKEFQGVPFLLVDPQGGRSPNVVLLHGPNGAIPPKMPKSVALECRSPAKAIHLLGGVSGWGYGGGSPSKTVSMLVRLKYADGTVEDHPLLDGVHLADYIRRVDVPGSTHAFQLRGQQLRYLTIHPQRTDTIESIELVKGNDATAPLVVAITVETGE